MRLLSLVGSIFLLLCCCITAIAEKPIKKKSVVDIGSRRELFVDDWLIDKMEGSQRRLHHPIPQEIAVTYDAPNEGNISYYVCVFQDEGKMRMYYRGAHYDWKKKKTTPQVICYAESQDGLNWTKPNLGLYEFNGSKENNIVWIGEGKHNFSPFKDQNPACKPDEKYKAIGGTKGLFAFSSPDGIHWKKMNDKPVITKGAFDSQNLAFWDTVRGRYVDFHRGFRTGVRDIMTCTSSDFLNWTKPEFINQINAEQQHLYTNATIAYERAPHIFLAFPKRFVPSRTAAYHPDPKNNHPGVSDGVLMSSRDGENWNRWDEAFLRPGQNNQRWWQRNNHIAWGILETKNDIPGEGRELSLYSIENYYVGPCRLRRFSLRLDGFVSVNAPYKGGEFTTRPLRFDGTKLEVNYATSAAGTLQVEIQDETGKPIPGYTLSDSVEHYGDELAGVIKWKSGSSLEQLQGKVVRLRFVLKDADVYSLRFIK
jgi:hypothetical protein